MKAFPILLAGVALLLGACGGGDDKATAGTAGEAAARQLEMVDKKQFGREWDELHPAQQAFVPRDLYASCAEKQVTGISVGDIKVLETFDEEAAIPGTDQRAKSTAVTVQFTASQGVRKQTSKETFHEFSIDGKWRWTLRDPEPYRQGKCPA